MCCLFSQQGAVCSHSQNYTYPAVARVKRNMFDKVLFKFKLALPTLDWKKELGSSAVGASFGIYFENGIDALFREYGDRALLREYVETELCSVSVEIEFRSWSMEIEFCSVSVEIELCSVSVETELCSVCMEIEFCSWSMEIKLCSWSMETELCFMNNLCRQGLYNVSALLTVMLVS